MGMGGGDEKRRKTEQDVKLQKGELFIKQSSLNYLFFSSFPSPDLIITITTVLCLINLLLFVCGS